jgi:hypothetical protein
MTRRREFLGSLGVGLVSARLASAQAQQSGQAGSGEASSWLAALGEAYRPRQPVVRVRNVKTMPLFKSPEMSPNAISAAPEGLWIAEQRSDNAHLVDWNGKLLKSVKTASRNTSGMGVGGGYIWMCANATPNGIFQTDMNAVTVSHRQIPLGPADGGGCHGAEYVDGKLWIAALRLRGILRVDAKTWQPEFLISYAVPRAHGVAFDRTANAIWMVTGNDQGAGLVKYDAATGQLLETAQFAATEADPHGLAWHDGVLYSSDAGIHPGWPDNRSPTRGYIFRIDLT